MANGQKGAFMQNVVVTNKTATTNNTADDMAKTSQGEQGGKPALKLVVPNGNNYEERVRLADIDRIASTQDDEDV